MGNQSPFFENYTPKFVPIKHPKSRRMRDYE
jgi:hypothetical protein